MARISTRISERGRRKGRPLILDGTCSMFLRLRRRYLDLLGSIYIYNEHRGYTAIDRVIEVAKARDPHDHASLARSSSIASTGLIIAGFCCSSFRSCSYVAVCRAVPIGLMPERRANGRLPGRKRDGHAELPR